MHLVHLVHWAIPFFEGTFLGLLAMALHECGHLAAAILLGVEVRRVAVDWRGICTVREPGPPLKNLLISVAGPLVNAILILAWFWSPAFCLANFCFASVNLLPIQQSDGLRALECWSQFRRMSR